MTNRLSIIYFDTDTDGSKLYIVRIDGRELHRLFTQEEVDRAREGYGA